MTEEHASEKAAKRIAHVKRHSEQNQDFLDSATHYIDINFPSATECALMLAGHASANAIYAWFGRNDLPALRQWMYVAAKFTKFGHELQSQKPPDIVNYPRSFQELLPPLLSNNQAIITWFSQCDWFWDVGRVEDHKTANFWVYQPILALRGDWPRLIARCEKVLGDPPKHSAMKYDYLEHQFFLALATADVSGMESAIQAMVLPKVLRNRSNFESGLTDDLISTTAVICAKIAWRYGYEITIDSPFIPAKWLPNTVLDYYDNHYGFLK